MRVQNIFCKLFIEWK